MGLSFMNTKVAKMGQGFASGVQETGSPWGGVAGSIASTHPDSALNKANGLYQTGSSLSNGFKGSIPNTNLGSEQIKNPEMGSEEGYGQQQYGLGGDQQKFQGGWDNGQSYDGLNTMQKRYSLGLGGKS